MSFGDKFRIWKFEKNRLEAFSDGVFAIIITLLVLEVKIPHLNAGASSSDLWGSLKETFPVIFSWIVSFLIVGAFWLNHHNILHMARKADYAMIWINILFLLFTSLIPFPSELMGEYPGIPLAVASLGVVMFFSTAMIIWLYYYVAANYLTDEYDKETVMKNVRKSFLLGPVLYIVAIASAWISTYITFSIYAVIPLIFLLPQDKPKASR